MFELRANGPSVVSGEPSIVTVLSPRADAANGEAIDEILVTEIADDAGQPDCDLGGVHVRQIAERIHRHDVLHIVGIALRGDRGGPALAFARDLENVELVDGGREIEVVDDALTGR